MPSLQGAGQDFPVAKSWLNDSSGICGETTTEASTTPVEGYGGGDFRATVTEASTTPVEDPFGKVKDGYICIQGPLCEATIREKGEAGPLGAKDNHGCAKCQGRWSRDQIRNKEGEFERIGYFAVPSKEGDPLIQAFKAKTVKRGHCKEFDGIDIYAVKIW
jgi:hypothetical protein